ncbi:hypothetical protein KSP40_PGU014842 [Platanthera guangdongensis]|uniref:Uncharacterized protein n=1 Tax=Platanthera guangdongensis TaxID=2320717 RepID=A0ABR2MK15_9ASPA
MSSSASCDAETMNSLGWEYKCEFEVDYKSQEYAAIVFAALDVDKELQPDKVKRQISISDGKLKVELNRAKPKHIHVQLVYSPLILKSYSLCFRRFEAVEARFLRSSFSAFADLLILATKIFEEYALNIVKS